MVIMIKKRIRSSKIESEIRLKKNHKQNEIRKVKWNLKNKKKERIK